jgi:hypothetical protein
VLRAGTSYFVLNPDGDLPDTQATFEPWLQDALRLQVRVFSGSDCGLLAVEAEFACRL